MFKHGFLRVYINVRGGLTAFRGFAAIDAYFLLLGEKSVITRDEGRQLVGFIFLKRITRRSKVRVLSWLCTRSSVG